MTRGLRFDLSRRGLLKGWTTAGLGALLGARRAAANPGARRAAANPGARHLGGLHYSYVRI